MKETPVVLTIAGSDSGGGAGIQADLKTFAANRVFGTSVITCVTSQNPREVIHVQEIQRESIRTQIQAVLGYFSVAAIKIGMLFSEDTILAVREALQQQTQLPPVVVDPVMVSTSGKKLLEENAVRALEKWIFPLGTVITPNLDEAGALLGERIETDAGMQNAAIQLFQKYKRPFLLKGGHLPKSDLAKDILIIQENCVVYEKPFVKNYLSHGTGCTYSSAIASNLALGKDLLASVAEAKDYLHNCIINGLEINGKKTLHHMAGFW